MFKAKKVGIIFNFTSMLITINREVSIKIEVIYLKCFYYYQIEY